MKKILFTSLFIVMVSTMFSCGDSTQVLSSTIGKPYELMVVASDDVSHSSVGDTIKAVFGQNVVMINIAEPLYNVINVTPQQVNSTLVRHRNILTLTVDSAKYPVTTMNAEFDKNAKDQAIINIQSPTIDSLTNYIWDNRALIVGVYDKLERDRFMARATKYRSEEIGKLIQEKFGFTMDVPSTYVVRNDKKDWLWISYELPFASLGIIIYTFEPTGDVIDMVAQRNIAVNQVPGPSEHSFMRTDTTFMPIYSNAKIKGHDWIEMRGFWSVQNDFMGGPFVNYTTKDPVNGKMLSIDCYVSSPSPKYGMRNYIRQLEAIVLTLKFKK